MIRLVSNYCWFVLSTFSYFHVQRIADPTLHIVHPSSTLITAFLLCSGHSALHFLRYVSAFVFVSIMSDEFSQDVVVTLLGASIETCYPYCGPTSQHYGLWLRPVGKFVSLLFFCVNASFVILSHNLSFQPYHTLPNDYACITLSYRFDTNNPAIPAMLQDNNVAVPDLTLQQLPKSSFIPDSSFIRQFAPVYYVYTYSFFIQFLVYGLVSEKASKLKEMLRIMGMKDSAFWWVIYGDGFW